MHDISQKMLYLLNNNDFFQSEIKNKHLKRAFFPGSHYTHHKTITNCDFLHAKNDLFDPGAYFRRRHIILPRLVPVGPDEIADHSAEGRRRIMRRLAKALRGERSRGRSGHWSYSLNRHLGLLQAFKAERAALRVLYPARIHRKLGTAK